MAPQFLDTAGLGPGYDHSAVPGRKPLVRKREDGQLAIVPQPDGDGPVIEKSVSGRLAWSTTRNRHSPTARYLYFEVDDAFLYDTDEPVLLSVTWFYSSVGRASSPRSWASPPACSYTP